MASNPLHFPQAQAVASDAESLANFLDGDRPVDEIVAAVVSMMNHDMALAPRIQEMLESAHRDGRLNDDRYRAIEAGIDEAFTEDLPTTWSEDVALACVLEQSAGEDAPPPVLRNKVSGSPPETGTKGELYPGAVLRDRFVLTAHIEAGGMGEIYKALDLRKKEVDAPDPWVAIKVIRRPFAKVPATLKALQREAVNSQRLSHPNIVRVYDFDRDGDYFFMTMEWLDGMSLVDLMQKHPRQPLPANRARDIVADIGSGLQYAHQRSVVHADIKPGNIFIDARGRAKLLDFGIARAGADDGAAEAAAGVHTPAYASCEVLEGEAPTVQDDIYSLACVAYRMLAGHRPFGTQDALAAEAAGQRPKRPKELSESQWSALEAGLAFRRAQRANNVQSFLDGFLDQPVPRVAGPDPAVMSASRKGFAMPGGFAPRAAILVAAGLGIAALAYRLNPRDDVPPVAVPAPAVAASGPAPEMAGPVIEAAVSDVSEPAAMGPPSNLYQPGSSAPAGATDVPVEREPEPAPQPPPERVKPEPEPQRVASATPPPATPAPVEKQPAPAAPPKPQSAAKPVAAGSEVAEPGSEEPNVFEGMAATTLLATAAPANDSPTAGANASAAARTGAGAMPFADAGAAAVVAPERVALSELTFDRFVEPEFPRRPSLSRISGWVLVKFHVTTSGETANVEVLESEPPSAFDKAATDAVERWRFEPPLIDGKPAEKISAVRLRFEPE